MEYLLQTAKTKYKRSIALVVLYSVVFLVLIGVIYLPFFLESKSMVWEYDGINQHYPALVYFSELLKGIFQGEGFPMVDFKIGMGFDTLTTLHYYAIGDPLNLFSVFVPKENMEVLYTVLILLRLYLSGLSFLYYCKVRNISWYPALLGSLLYVFCGYVFFSAVRHPFFINPMIYLPLLLVGVEKLLNRNKPGFFTFMVFLSAVSNFYFFYMLTILIFGYGILRFYECNKKGTPPVTGKSFFKVVSKAMFFYVLGILMAAFIFLPVCGAFLNNGRLNSGYEQNLFLYPFHYYGLLVQSFLAANTTGGYWTVLTFGSVIPAAVLIIFTRKDYRGLKLSFIILTAGLMLPSFGYIMNGFAYVSNRWEFAYSFLAAFLFSASFKELENMKKKELVLIAGGSVLYAIAGMLRPTVYILIACIFLVLTVLCLVLLSVTDNKKLVRGFLFILVCCNLSINGFLVNDSRFGNYVGEFIKDGEVDKQIGASAVSMLPIISDEDFYRVETYGDRFLNEGLTMGFYDVSGYYSVMDKRVTEYLSGLELASQRAAYRFDNFDARASLSSLAGVNYFVTTKKSVPYDYRYISSLKVEDRSYYLYKNNNHLSLGFTYDSYMPREGYEALSSIRKQEVQLRGAVLEEIPGEISLDSLTGRLGADGNSFTEHKVNYKYEGKIKPIGNNLIVKEKGAKLRIYFNGVADAETYIRLENFHINEQDALAVTVKAKGNKGVSKTINIRNKTNNAYFGKKDYLINLGYSNLAMSYCEITFNQPGRYHLGELEVFTVPVSIYKELVQERQQNQMEEVKLSNNTVSGKIEIAKDSLLFFSIPYSKGWKAYVNDEEQRLLPANVMYMALPLHKGTYNIELIYTTPYLKEGVILSAAGWCVFIFLWYKNRAIFLFKQYRKQTCDMHGD